MRTVSADIEDIYQLLIKKGLSEVEIQKQVKAKMNEYGGYLTDSGALYLIAKEYDVSFKEASESTLGGFNMQALPVERAPASLVLDMGIGVFQGIIAATTPRGSRWR